ncbi:MAG: cellulose biosynthesis cyclic di-GMP-binding regulatory protein BcsB [Gloeomargarita sp. SKYBB_i_bin120]|nr:cellulose biosynthesis cyclic di-GMP-binding regulatory protein BcsB [Gloeomargarita sp. SKYG98]MCS7291405.1 cellulose biosynthesis cyclic di-GMP-binding regulatory protein BcsB [Gloeomargarita sp. SKYB120]MDW8176965.1 cellulose biosynthesis cyclic di-GMP-binding regulatory protein BcsB [Gloeomargarita sp. SKYBB_i_bin120]
MKRLVWAVGVVGLGVLPAHAQPVRTLQRIPLRNLGYTRPVVLRGPNPEFGVSLPLLSRNLDTKQSFVQLELAPSPVLRPNSTVRVLVNGRPERVFLVKDLLPQKSVRIPLRLPPPGEQFLSVEVQGYLRISQNFCDDAASGNLFLTVGENSFFQLAQTETAPPINGWFRPTYNRVALVVPPQMDAATTQAALWLYSVLSYHFRDTRVPVQWFAGDVAALKLDPKVDGVVLLHRDAQAPDIHRQGNRLRVKARPEVIRALMELQPAFVAPDVRVVAADAPSAPPTRNRRLFAELGWPETVKTGLGNQSFRLTFDLAQLGGRPRDLALALRSRFGQMSERDRRALSAQIFFNGALVNSFNVGTDTQLNVTLALPERRIRRVNHLDLVFSATQEEYCRFPSPLTVQVLGSSYLDWTGYQPPRGTFDDVPQAFLGQGQVVVDTGNPAVVAGTAQVLGMLSRLGKRPLLPQVVPASEITDWNNLPGRPAWRLVGTGPQTPFNSPIRLGQDFVILNPVNQKPLLQAQLGASIGVLQAFLHQGAPTLWLSWWGNATDVVARTGAVLADPIAGWGHQLQGNVATVTPQGTVEMWDLTGETLEVRYPAELNWWLVLRRYRWVLLALFLVFGGLAAWRLYRRLGQPPKPPTPPS